MLVIRDIHDCLCQTFKNNKENFMKKWLSLSLLFFGLTTQAFGNEQISQKLMKEWDNLKTKTAQVSADGELGGYMFYKEYGNLTLLWRTSDDMADNEVIRLFLEKNNGSNFVITYHKSNIISPGRTVLRRFVGGEPVGWINHTIDFKTGLYLGTQGQAPTLTSEEKKLMKAWSIENF
jgi:hypothetical protein